MKGRVIDFVTRFIQHRNFKSLTKQVKNELPMLLGYDQAEVLLYDNTEKNLYCMSIQAIDQDSIDPDAEKPSFENDFTFDTKKIVRFPTNMGISGFAYNSDAVCFINNYEFLRETTIGPIYSKTSS